MSSFGNSYCAFEILSAMNPKMEETGYEAGSIAMSMNGLPKKPIPVSGD